MSTGLSYVTLDDPEGSDPVPRHGPTTVSPGTSKVPPPPVVSSVLVSLVSLVLVVVVVSRPQIRAIMSFLCHG